MKQNSRFNKFGRNDLPEKYVPCSCGSKAKLKSRKNYPFGRKSKARITQYYICDKCGKITFLNERQKGGRR